MKTGTKVIIGLSVVALAVTGIILYNKNREEDNSDSNEGGGSEGGSSAPLKVYTPFKSKAEGDAFRQWVNNTYPVTARLIDLDKSGSYNNKYIGEAWDKYGDEYSKLSVLLGVKSKIGVGATLKKDAVSLLYRQSLTDAKDSKKAFFYNSGKYVIYKTVFGLGLGVLQSGTFASDGQILTVTEGKNKGRIFEHGSVRSNLVNAIT